MNYQAWEECRKSLELELNQDEFSTWISPLAFSQEKDEFGMQAVTLLAPNDFIKEHVKQNYDSMIKQYLSRSLDSENLSLNYDLFNSPKPLITKDKSKKIPFLDDKENSLFENFTFETFVEGKSNNIALAAAKQVADSPKGAYNPLFIYGGVGLGKTHLMHAVGNKLKEKDPSKRIVYIHSERFVSDMVKSLQLGAQSQEELFHTFNALLEGGQQMILTCDRYPKEIEGLEERLKSRLGWGLPVIVEPPELETRVAILLKKAEELNLNMPQDCAFFISERIRSNVRELEGALKRVGANAKFANKEVDLNLIKESLRDLLAIQARQVSIDNIQKTVSDYFNIRLSDLLSSKRNRSLARPRQLSMSLAKELTNHSLPEIGDAFGGRDHTTVLHACKKIGELRQGSTELDEDYKNLVRVLTA
jgi:chromosomal replication initiator protein